MLQFTWFSEHPTCNRPCDRRTYLTDFNIHAHTIHDKSSRAGPAPIKHHVSSSVATKKPQQLRRMISRVI